jgi:protocatechuate 3,4-dioxygenase, alpha subunit
MLPPTPSQTVGPYFRIGTDDGFIGPELVAGDHPGALRLFGVVRDGDGAPVTDAMIEIWQANAAGRYAHPEDRREEVPLEDGFEGFGRAMTDEEGRYSLVTVKPGPVPGPDGAMQAPHIDVSVFARGLLKRLVTRVYFPDEAPANEADPVLSSVSDAEARASLVAVAEDGGLRFDINLQGDRETTFFAV